MEVGFGNRFALLVRSCRPTLPVACFWAKGTPIYFILAPCISIANPCILVPYNQPKSLRQVSPCFQNAEYRMYISSFVNLLDEQSHLDLLLMRCAPDQLQRIQALHLTKVRRVFLMDLEDELGHLSRDGL